MYGEELKTKTEAHKKLKKAIENAKVRYHKQHPKALERHKEAVDAAREDKFI